MTPDERADALEADEAVRLLAHSVCGAFGRRLTIVVECLCVCVCMCLHGRQLDAAQAVATQEGQTKPPSLEESVETHFICFSYVL